MKILSKYILKELAFPFLIALGLISFLLIMNRVITLVDLVLRYHVGIWVVCKLVAYVLPATFAITVPMSLLVAILMAFGRMAADMELTAAKAGRVSLARLFLPVILLSALLSVGMLAFNEYVLPRANLGYKILFYDIVRQRSNLVIQPGTYIHDFDGIVIYVGKKDPDQSVLEDITLFLLPNGQNPLQLVRARWGKLVSDPKSFRVYLQLHQGSVQVPNQSDPLRFTQMFFDSSVLDLDLQGGLQKMQGVDKQPQEMTIAEIRHRLAQMPPGDPQRASWAVEMDKKIAIPFACLVFAVIGCPLGALTRRGGRLAGFLFAILLIFNYYILLSVGETYGDRGSLAPWLSMWLPNLEILALGAWLTWVCLKEKPLLPRVTLVGS